MSTKANAVTRKRPTSKPPEKITPVHLEDGLSIRMSLHDVIKAVQMIEKHGHLAKFTKKLKREEVQVRLPAKTVNLVKNFVADNGMHKTPMGKHIVGGRGVAPRNASARARSAGTSAAAGAENGGDPNQCNFGTAERG